MTTVRACRSLYVHVPFCRALCGYCDFYSQVIQPAAVPPLVDSLLRELGDYGRRCPLSFDTVFVGGGTPTVLPPPDLRRLLRAIRDYCDPAANLEFTVEANPATVSADVADVLHDTGVNRVSMGAQSFDEDELRTLDRTHRPAEVGPSVDICRRSGVRQISLDLMFGIPGQSCESWVRSMRAALALQPDHLSCYGLTYEPGTPLFDKVADGLIQRVDPDIEADMYEAALDVLPAAGFAHYEISNFARPGAECRHNLRYWHNEPYVGIGPAAAGFVDEVRYKNVADTAAYVAMMSAGQSPRTDEERLSPERRARETAVLNLRLVKGIDRAAFARRFGLDPLEVFPEAVAQHVADGLLVVDADSIRLTRAGFLVADRVMVDFV